MVKEYVSLVYTMVRNDKDYNKIYGKHMWLLVGSIEHILHDELIHNCSFGA